MGLGQATVSARDSLLGITSSASRGDTTFRVIAELNSIKVRPRRLKMRLGTKRQKRFTATGVYSNGDRIDLADRVIFSVTEAAIATISDLQGNEGTVIPLSRGRTTITVVEPITGAREQKPRKLIVKKAKKKK